MELKKDQALPKGIHLHPTNGIYYIHYKDTLGRRRREQAGTYKMAEDLLIKRHMERLRSKLPGERNPYGIKVSELIDDAINYAFANNDQKAAHDLRLKMERIRKDFGDKMSCRVQRGQISAWLDKQTAERNWKPSSRNRYHSAFSLIFRVAIENGKMETNPAKGIQMKQESSGRVRFLGKEEEARLVSVIRERYPAYVPIFMLSIHTGMRLSEQLRSVVGDYNPETGMLEVRQKKNRRGPTTRYVPLTPMAVEAYNTLCEGKQTGDLLTVNMSGELMKRMDYWFDECLKDAGVTDYTWHCNRHTFCSRLVMAGVPLGAVAQLAGHASISMTMRYSHLTPDASKMAVERMMKYYE